MAAPARPGMLSCTIKDKGTLYQSYMPFVKNGGLFIPTEKKFGLGDEVFMLLTLMDSGAKLPVAGTVIWVTPQGSQGNRKTGVGVQFSEKDEGETSRKIEKYLAGALTSDRVTHTM